MPSIDGLNRYLGRVEADERRIAQWLMAEYTRVHGEEHEGCENRLSMFAAELLKLRNVSRDVGWMRRLRADVQKAKGWEVE